MAVFDQINIFDFDNTLFKSPIPNPALWDPMVIGKLKEKVGHGGLGWYEDVATLSPPMVPANMDESCFNKQVLAAVKDSSADETQMTVLLTGRPERFRSLISRICASQGLVFDSMGFKANEARNTMEHKCEYIEGLLKKHMPLKLFVYEDRAAHADIFEELFREWAEVSYGARTEFIIIRVPQRSIIAPVEAERKLVDDLIAKASPPYSIVDRVWCTVLSLDDASRSLILNTFTPPVTWMKYANTLDLATEALTASGTNHRLGASLQLEIVAFGESRGVSAVKARWVDSKHPFSSNPTPVGIVASLATHPPNVLTKNIAFVWRTLQTPISVQGVLREVSKGCLLMQGERSPTRARPNARESTSGFGNATLDIDEIDRPSSTRHPAGPSSRSRSPPRGQRKNDRDNRWDAKEDSFTDDRSGRWRDESRRTSGGNDRDNRQRDRYLVEQGEADYERALRDREREREHETQREREREREILREREVSRRTREQADRNEHDNQIRRWSAYQDKLRDRKESLNQRKQVSRKLAVLEKQIDTDALKEITNPDIPYFELVQQTYEVVTSYS